MHNPRHRPSRLHARKHASDADAFRELELPSSSSLLEVKQAYLRKMKQVHPDVNPDGDTTAAAARVTCAYSHLMEV